MYLYHFMLQRMLSHSHPPSPYHSSTVLEIFNIRDLIVLLISIMGVVFIIFKDFHAE